MVICLEQVADLRMSQLMPLPLTVCCFSKIQIGFTFLVPAYSGSPGKGLLNGCVCVRERESDGVVSQQNVSDCGPLKFNLIHFRSQHCTEQSNLALAFCECVYHNEQC